MITINIEVIKKRLTICNFLTPDVHNIINSLSLRCLTIKRNKAKRNDSGMNFVKTPKKFNKVYKKYVLIEYPFSTIRSKKFTAFTVIAIRDKPNSITKNVFSISLKKF